jgi:chromate transporter
MLTQLWSIFFTCAKVGVFGYGGGPSMIPLMQVETVNRMRWMTDAEFVDVLAAGNALPGPIATKMAAFIGYKIAGYPGAIAGLIGMVLPSAILMLALAFVLIKHKESTWVKASMKAVRPVIVALMALVVWDIFPSSVKGWDTALIAIIALVLFVLKVHPALLIALGAAAGILLYGRG